MNAVKVSSFSVCTNQWNYDDAGGSTDLFVCEGENNPDLNQKVGAYAYTAGPIGGIYGGNALYLLTEQFEINGCVLQRIGNWDSILDEPTECAIWRVEALQGTKNKGCPKATNIVDYKYSFLNGTVTDTQFETYTIGFKKSVINLPLTTIKHSKE